MSALGMSSDDCRLSPDSGFKSKAAFPGSTGESDSPLSALGMSSDDCWLSPDSLDLLTADYIPVSTGESDSPMSALGMSSDDCRLSPGPRLDLLTAFPRRTGESDSPLSALGMSSDDCRLSPDSGLDRVMWSSEKQPVLVLFRCIHQMIAGYG